MRAPLLPAFILMGLATLPAGAVSLCAKAKADGSFNTSVKIRTACKPGETQLDPGALGLQGPPGPPGGPGIFVVDADNAVVGTVLTVADTWITSSNQIF